MATSRSSSSSASILNFKTSNRFVSSPGWNLRSLSQASACENTKGLGKHKIINFVAIFEVHNSYSLSTTIHDNICLKVSNMTTWKDSEVEILKSFFE